MLLIIYYVLYIIYYLLFIIINKFYNIKFTLCTLFIYSFLLHL